MRIVLASLALLLAVPAQGQEVRGQGGPAALHTDPAPDAANPAGRSDLAIPSHGESLLGQILLPSGPGPHPLLILYHGFPGYELNLDVGQAARRQGWAVVAFHYRGSWGSPGNFSFSHVLEDSQAALDWLIAPAQTARFKLDPARVIVAGHSMGGFAAAQTLAARKAVRGLILMDMWNPGPGGREAALSGQTAASLAIMGKGLPPLRGTSAQALTDELMANHARFDLRNHAAAIADRPVLMMSATKALVADSRGLETPLRAAGAASISVHEWPTDHSFSDHRIKLTATTLDWLKQFEAKR
jgi:pimeloyl-ACP methyl ester carboxylesterase